MRSIVILLSFNNFKMKMTNITEITIKRKILSKAKIYLNNIFIAIGLPIEVRRTANASTDMITLEQIVNLQHLIDQVIFFSVPGDMVECGSHKGKSAMHIQAAIQKRNSSKKLHVFDKFNKGFDSQPDIKEALLENFKQANVPPPEIHEGFFIDTLPSQLPDQICFAHIDCGYGGNPEIHMNAILFCLEHIYPRLSIGGVCLLMDYHDVEQTIKGFDANPGVKMAMDKFLVNKKEKMDVLYGNEFSHGYFRKL